MKWRPTDLHQGSGLIRRRMNKRAGKAAPLAIVVALLAIVTVAIFILSAKQDSEINAASRFLVALGKADAKTLTELSYMDGDTEEEIRAKWDKTLSYSKHYLFVWSIQRSFVQGDEATVTLKFFKDAGKSTTFEEKLEIPLKRVNGKWKVDVRGISREAYPSLPI
jgi:hypothetical protein